MMGTVGRFQVPSVGKTGPPVADTDTYNIFLAFGKHYLRVPAATKAVHAHKIVPKKKSSYGLDFIPWNAIYTGPGVQVVLGNVVQARRHPARHRIVEWRLAMSTFNGHWLAPAK